MPKLVWPVRPTISLTLQLLTIYHTNSKQTQYNCNLARESINLQCTCSANEIDDNEVEHHVGKDKVCEGSLGGDVPELALVLRVGLHAQAHCQYKGTDAGDESGEERVEGERTDEGTVRELYDSR